MARRGSIFGGLTPDQKVYLCGEIAAPIAAIALAYATGHDGPVVLAILVCVFPPIFFGSITIFRWANRIAGRVEKILDLLKHIDKS